MFSASCIYQTTYSLRLIIEQNVKLQLLLRFFNKVHFSMTFLAHHFSNFSNLYQGNKFIMRIIILLKFHRNCALVNHATIRSRASTKDFRGSFCFLLQTALKSSLNAALAMICLKSEKAKLLRPLTLWRRSGMFSSRVA